MNQSQALLPLWIETKPNKHLLNVLAVLAGTGMLTVLAKISIVLPFTPVPITGQTFGVAFLALSWGRRRAVASFALYLAEAFVGLPVLAVAVGGATFGYLIGMLIACGVVGFLADQGYAKTLRSAFLCCVAGSVCIFSCGLIGLSIYLPANSLLGAGLIPFIPGDIIKNLLAAGLAVSMRRVNIRR